jgi:hypothetical protein
MAVSSPSTGGHRIVPLQPMLLASPLAPSTPAPVAAAV